MALSYVRCLPLRSTFAATAPRSAVAELGVVSRCYPSPVNDMTTSPTSTQFFELWVQTCTTQFVTLYRDWPNPPVFTADILSGPTSVMGVIETQLGLHGYSNYYHIDEILYADQDLVPGIPVGQVWVRRIRVAFEHENFFLSGLFQEVSHLLITDCDLRVLVSYPGNDAELNYQLQYLHSIVAGSDRASTVAASQSFLFIVGWRDTTKGTIEWWGYVYEPTTWRRI